MRDHSIEEFRASVRVFASTAKYSVAEFGEQEACIETMDELLAVVRRAPGSPLTTITATAMVLSRLMEIADS